MLGDVTLPLAARQASARWARQLESWAIPEPVLAAAPVSPWGFPPGLFARSVERALTDPDPTPSRLRAAEALGDGGSLLDVGAGGGAASLPLAPPAHLVIAVDESPAMLAAFADAAARRGVRHTEIEGRWPHIAGDTRAASVVVCNHVLYNVADLAPFLVALNTHAERRVVVEVTYRHPQSDLSPLWIAIHGIERPTGPIANDAVEVAMALGYDVRVEEFERGSLWYHHSSRGERIAFARRRLCVGTEHDAAIGAYLDETTELPRRLVTLWWDRAD